LVNHLRVFSQNCPTEQSCVVPHGCEDRTQDGPASEEKGSNVGPLARLYSG
jgi:hypothetical protein